MVKGWADHCSSDEEDDDEYQPVVVVSPPGSLRGPPSADAHEPGAVPREDSRGAPQTNMPQKKVYDYPTEPPFTAYVGNLAYTLTDSNDLAAEVQALASEKLHVSIRVIDARIMKDRNNNDRPRGFGYVEVETVEMLQQLMDLNSSGNAQIAGRTVTFDVSNNNNNSNNRRNSNNSNSNHRSSNNSNIDGSKFRGGRFTTKQGQQGSAPESSTPRDAAAQRPSLKLKPRTKPVEEQEADPSQSSNSDIFGGAKARDETSWKERRTSGKQHHQGNASTEGERQQQQQTRKDSNNKGRGGRSGMRGGRGDVGGRGPSGEAAVRQSDTGGESTGTERASFRDKKKTDHRKPHAPALAPKPAPPAEPEKAPPKKPSVTNVFAALAMDSDSD